MAKRENQGLHIALIVFVFVTVVFMVTTVFFWKKSEDSKSQLAEAEKARSTAQTELGEKNYENEQLRMWLGAGEETLDSVKQKFVSDMQSYAALNPQEVEDESYDSQVYNYGALPNRLNDALKQRSQQLANARSNEAKLTQEVASLRQELKNTQDGAKAEIDRLAGEHAQAQRTFDNERARISKQMADQKRLFDEQQKKLADQIVSKDSEIGDQKDTIYRLEQTVEILQRRLAQLMEDTSEFPDGRVVSVNQRNRVAYINLGELDGVRPQMLFSVYDADESKLSGETTKGQIEIIRVIDAHQSQARILDDELRNPIIPRDIIASPVWSRGSRQRFALAGFMDIDGDGLSDRELIRNLITSNGGIIDAELDDKGQRTGGELSVKTRYLVLGEPPTDRTAAGGAGIGAFSEIVREASEFGGTANRR